MRVMDDLRRWRQDAVTGPQTWVSAWDRTIELLDPLWHDLETPGGFTPPLESEAGAALATALYIVAAERGIQPDEVSRAFVEDLAGRPIEQDLPDRWSARLIALGHDLEAQDDPVSTCWRELRIDYPEPPESFIEAGDTSLFKDPGVAVIGGISYILAPRNQLRF